MKKALILFTLLIICSSIKANCPGLSTTLPSTQSELEQLNFQIAKCYAPAFVQIAETDLHFSVNGLADLILKVNYDGDYFCGNNWENLESSGIDLHARVYHSVVWMNYGWIITYGVYHPRDYSHNLLGCCYGSGGSLQEGDNHENDFEGAIVYVSHETLEVIGAASISHHDLLRYKHFTEVPAFKIDNRSHAIEITPFCIDHDGDLNCDDCQSGPGIIYEYSGFNLPPMLNSTGDNLEGFAYYDLQDIFSSDPNSLANLRNTSTMFSDPYTFTSSDFGESVCTDYGGTASAPWGWSQMQYRTSELEFNFCDAYSNVCHHFGVDFIFQPNLRVTNNPYSKVFGCGQNFPRELTVFEGTFMDYNEPVDIEIAKITVERYATLEINFKNISMAPEASIIVKEGGHLKLVHSTLENCEFDTKWQGITVEDGGRIDVIDSKISRADIGINILPDYTYADIGPKLWFSLNSEVSDCDTGIKIRESNGLVNNARHVFSTSGGNNSILNNNIGLDVFESSNVTVQNTSFINNNTGIYALNSSLHVQSGNEFLNGQRGIFYYQTSPSLTNTLTVGSMTEQNYFNGGIGIGIYGSEGLIKSSVINNVFTGCDAAIASLGFANYVIANNSIDNGDIGAFFLGQGDMFSYASCNQISDLTSVGLAYLGNCEKSSFLQNSFENISEFDVTGSLWWNLRDNIGEEAASANNLFSTGAKFAFSNNNLGTFKYWYDINDPNNRKKPETSSNYEIDVSDDEGNNCIAGNVGTFFLIDPDGDGVLGLLDSNDPTGCCKGCILDSIETHLKFVIDNGGDDPRIDGDDGTDDGPEIDVEEEILDQWITCGIYIANKTNDSEMLLSILQPLQSFKWKRMLYAYYLDVGNIASAHSVISSLNTEKADQAQFYNSQELYLRCLDWKNNKNWNIDSTDISLMKDLSGSLSTSSGYGSSIYTWMTGDILSPNMNIPIDTSMIRSSLTEQIEGSSSPRFKDIIYPNPVRDELVIEVDRAHNIVKTTIFNIGGIVVKTVISSSDQNIIKINTTSLPSGVYIVSLTDGKGKITFNKIIKQ